MLGILQNEGEGRKWKDRKTGKFPKLLLEANTIAKSFHGQRLTNLICGPIRN